MSVELNTDKWSDQLFQRGMNRLGLSVGEKTWTLFRGVRWNALASTISRIFSGLATLMAGRMLGPAGFGEANLAIAATAWIQVPMLMSISTSMMHYLPQTHADERDSLAATSLHLLTACAAITAVIGFGFERTWTNWAGVPLHVFRWAMYWTIGYTIFTGSVSLLSGYEKFATRAKVQLIFAVVFAGVVTYLLLAKKLTPAGYVLAMGGAYGVAGLCGLLGHWPKHGGNRTGQRAKRVLIYGFIASAGAIASALFNAPGRVILNQYLPLSSLGILAAYQGGSIFMAHFYLAPVTQVFFPIASRTADRQALLKKMSRVLIFSAPFLTIGFIAICALYIWVMGKDYSLSLNYLLTFSVVATIATAHGLFGWFLASEGIRGMAVNGFVAIVSGLINAGACYMFVPRWGIVGVAIAYGFASLMGIILCVGALYLAAAWESKSRESSL